MGLGIRGTGVVLVVALTGLLVPLAPATAVPAATALTLDVPTSAPLGDTVHPAATLTDSAGQGIAGVQVTLEHQTTAGWDQVATTATGADGTAHFDYVVSDSSATLRAEFTGTADLAGSTSSEHVVAGEPPPSTLTLTGPASFVDETSATLTVGWTDDHGTAIQEPVDVYSHTKGKSWTLDRTVTIGTDGTVSFDVSPRVDTWWQARGAGGTTWSAATSATFALDNTPPGIPWHKPKHAPTARHLKAQKRAVGDGANADVSHLSDAVWHSMTGHTWHKGCPVGRSSLRLMEINYWGFDGYRHRGQMVVNANATDHFVGAFKALYDAKIPIHAMFRVDKFGYSKRSHGGDDFSAMKHDDTSAFNCRWVTGTPHVTSPHSYGYAVDIDTWENPYHSRVGWLPDSWWIHHSDPKVAWRSTRHKVVQIMHDHGFVWTYGHSDTQHFDVAGHRRGLVGLIQSLSIYGPGPVLD